MIMDGVSEKIKPMENETFGLNSELLFLSPRGPYRPLKEEKRNSPQATSICHLEWQWSEEPVLGSGWKTVTMETQVSLRSCADGAVQQRSVHTLSIKLWHFYTVSDWLTLGVHGDTWHFGFLFLIVYIKAFPLFFLYLNESNPFDLFNNMTK